MSTSFIGIGFSDDGQSSVKPHLVQKNLVGAVRAEALTRGWTVVTAKKRKALVSWDQGGMVIVGEPRATFNLDGRFSIQILACQIDSLIASGERAPIRKYGGRQFVKLHGHWTCIVITPKDRDALLAAMRRRRNSIRARYDKFFSAWKAANPIPNSVALATA